MRQIWEKEGVGNDHDTLSKIISEFRLDGVVDMSSNMRLTIYLRALADEKIFEMMEMDKEATLQMLVDTLGVEKAFEKAQGKRAQEEKTHALIAEAILELKSALILKDREIMTLKAKLYDATCHTNEGSSTNPTENSNKGEMQECSSETERTQSGLSE